MHSHELQTRVGSKVLVVVDVVVYESIEFTQSIELHVHHQRRVWLRFSNVL